MPYHYGSKVYKTFAGLVRGIRADHPTWTVERAKRYAGKLRYVQIVKPRKR